MFHSPNQARELEGLFIKVGHQVRTSMQKIRFDMYRLVKMNLYPPAGPLPRALFFNKKLHFLVKNHFPPAGPLPQAPFFEPKITFWVKNPFPPSGPLPQAPFFL